jgi:hypothetical protein
MQVQKPVVYPDDLEPVFHNNWKMIKVLLLVTNLIVAFVFFNIGSMFFPSLPPFYDEIYDGGFNWIAENPELPLYNILSGSPKPILTNGSNSEIASQRITNGRTNGSSEPDNYRNDPATTDIDITRVNPVNVNVFVDSVTIITENTAFDSVSVITAWGHEYTQKFVTIGRDTTWTGEPINNPIFHKPLTFRTTEKIVAIYVYYQGNKGLANQKPLNGFIVSDTNEVFTGRAFKLISGNHTKIIEGESAWTL